MQFKYLSVIFAVVIALSLGQAQAQDNRTAISITVPQFSKSIYEDLVQQFEAENPGYCNLLSVSSLHCF